MRRLALLLLTFAAACSSGGSDQARSCGGSAVPNCLPYEYTSVRSASIEPADLMVGQLVGRATFHVEVDTCGDDAPGELIVAVTAVASGTDPLSDGGTVDRRFPLIELRDDGVGADMVAGDGIIDKSTPNPFDNRELPPNTELRIEFAPQRTASCSGGSCTGGTCSGDAFMLTYRTGSLAPPPTLDAGTP